MLQVGTSIKDMTPDISGITMMGWGMFDNKAYGIGMPIKSRAFVFYNDQTANKIAYICAEIAFITIALKKGVIDYLKANGKDYFKEENVMISATHTHSSPGGYSHYMMYNLTSKGFVKEVFDSYVESIAQSIIAADNNLKTAQISFNSGEISENKNVAFNRSIEAYNLNPEVRKVKDQEKHLAIDRTMSFLRINQIVLDSDLPLNFKTVPIGVINWFAVHCTNIHSDNYLIHPDNKGIAANEFEKYIKIKEKSPAFVSAFAQSACGDVTPNFKFHPNIKFHRGEFEDDYKSAEYNGLIQAEKAKELFYDDDKIEISDKLDYIHSYVDFSNVNIDPEFSNGIINLKTSSASIGTIMLTGTEEGPGISFNLKKAIDLFSIVLKNKYFSSLSPDQKKDFKDKLKSQGNKIIFADMGEQSIFNNKNMEKLPIPQSADKMVELLKTMAKNNSIGNKPWTPNILPIQIFILGELAIISVPAEFTTVAGKRLKKTVLNILKFQGVKEIVLSGYSNGYSGYVTTNEEYQIQRYEGGSTHFGQWTLAAYQTEFKKLALELNQSKELRKINHSIQPHLFSEKEINKRGFIANSI